MISVETARELFQLRSYLRERLLTPSASKTPETLYHYTDAAGLLGIVTAGTLWATHYAYLNDASEFKYAVRMMKGVVEEATVDAEPDSWKARFRHVISQGGASDYSAGWAEDSDEQQFVACFSERGDELSQWRGYGKSIGGYSLGFPFAHLQAIETRINDSQDGKALNQSSPRSTVEFFPCWYDEQAQKALIAEGLERALHHCATTHYSVDDSSLAALLRAILRPVSSCFKDPAFKDEREWRLVVRVWRPSYGSVRYGDDRERTQDDIRMDQMATAHFRKGEYSLVPYVVVPVVLNAALSLSQVVVGPTPLPENARAAAMHLLHPGPGEPRIPTLGEFLRSEPEESRTPAAATAGQRIVCTNVMNSSIPFRRV